MSPKRIAIIWLMVMSLTAIPVGAYLTFRSSNPPSRLVVQRLDGLPGDQQTSVQDGVLVRQHGTTPMGCRRWRIRFEAARPDATCEVAFPEVSGREPLLLTSGESQEVEWILGKDPATVRVAFTVLDQRGTHGVELRMDHLVEPTPIKTASR